MSKWANYGISAVRFNPQRTLIEKVRAQLDLETLFGAVHEYSRPQLFAALHNKITFITILMREEKGKWKKGLPVRIENIGGFDYLKTGEDGGEKDDLGELPEF